MWGCKLNRVLSIAFSSNALSMYFTLKIMSIKWAYFSKVLQSSNISVLLSLFNRYLGHSAKNSYLNVHSSSTPEHTTTWEGLFSFLHTQRSQRSATAINLSMLFNNEPSAINLSMLFNNEPSVLKRLHILSLFSSFWIFQRFVAHKIAV